MLTPETIVSISDPGEVGKKEHTQSDRIVVRISNMFAWIFPLLMVAICSQVLLRSAGLNQAWLDDFQWWLYGSAVLVGIGYAVTTNSHVRVDIRYENFTPQKKLRTDIFALAWLFLPFIILCWDVTLSYALVSVASDEGSDSPNGLHNLWILKSFMNISFLFIAFATWAAYTRSLAKLTEPLLWKKLLWAFPSTMFAINLVIYYALWWGVKLTSPEGTTDRDVGRHAIFGEIEFGNYEIKYTILMTVVATLAVIGLARILAHKQTA